MLSLSGENMSPSKNPLLPAYRFALIAVLAVFVAITARITTAHACACCGTYKVIHVAPGDVLNVRTGPGTGYRVIAGLAPGEGCIIKTGKKRGRWVSVAHGQVKGWVHSYYLGFIR